MELALQGKIAIVTGASKGIGLAITRALVEEGVFVVAGARSVTGELAELTGAGRAQGVAVDLSTADGATTLAAAAQVRGPIDILVNNVGALGARLDGFLAITDEQWLTSLTVNLMSAVRMTRAALPSMLAAGHGNIVTISSVNAFLPDPGVLDYSAAKAALTNFCKSLSKEVGPKGIRVNTISPGPVETDLWLGAGGVAATVGAASGVDPAQVAQQVAAQSVTGRFTRPSEIADLVLVLASGRAGNVTGSDFVIDGGLVTTM
ncbi:MAG: short-chain dehydrogenase/reductase [Pseudonocardiales bacterium]|nr:short-chain dehydrogenase/reductase [Pseudonocardiales bacterium]